MRNRWGLSNVSSMVLFWKPWQKDRLIGGRTSSRSRKVGVRGAKGFSVAFQRTRREAGGGLLRGVEKDVSGRTVISSRCGLQVQVLLLCRSCRGGRDGVRSGVRRSNGL